MPQPLLVKYMQDMHAKDYNYFEKKYQIYLNLYMKDIYNLNDLQKLVTQYQMVLYLPHLKATPNLIRSCLVGTDFDTEELKLFDLYFLMFKLRELTYGSDYKVKPICPETGNSISNGSVSPSSNIPTSNSDKSTITGWLEPQFLHIGFTLLLVKYMQDMHAKDYNYFEKKYQDITNLPGINLNYISLNMKSSSNI